jgi:hypothetical protein
VGISEETITVKLPAGLKDAVEVFMRSRGMTLSGVVRRALEDLVTPAQRVSELPGLSKAFAEFLESKEFLGYGRRALLLVVDAGGHQAMYPGYIDLNYSNGSIVAIKVVAPGGGAGQDPPWLLLRKDIVAWYTGPENFFAGEVVKLLMERGWMRISYPPR